MARKEDINRDLVYYLDNRVKYKPFKKPKNDEFVPKGLSSNTIHIIHGECSWFDRFKSKIKTTSDKKREKEVREKEEELKDISPEEVQKVIEKSNWHSSEEFDKENEQFNKKEDSFGEGFMKFIKRIFSSESAQNNDKGSDFTENSLIGGKMDSKTKSLIDSLIDINIDILSKLSPEELDKFRRSDTYQKLKDDIKEYKELIKDKD